MSEEQRLSKVLARAGVASRREAEQLITEGHVTVNGETALHPGHPVDADNDVIRVDGRTLPKPPPLVYFLLYKPRDYITTRDDPEERKSVLDLVAGLPVRVEPVGRLDINTEGALLFTNDGDLAHKLTHPSSQVPKRYLAKVWKVPSEKTLERLRRGVVLDDGRTAPAKVRVAEVTDTGNAWVEITVTEGRNRLIRRMLEAVGHPVSKLRRESFATVSLRTLERGQLRPLTADEVARLRDIAAGIDPMRAGHSSRYRAGFARPKPGRPTPNYKKKRARLAGRVKGSKPRR